MITAEVSRLRRFAAAMIGDEGVADHLVQEIIALALADLDALPDDQELSVSLFTVLYQMRREAIEKHDAKPMPAMSVGFENILFQRLPGADRSELEEFASAMSGLAEEDRAILLLISLENFNYRDISVIVGSPAGRIMSKVTRARQQLQALLKVGIDQPDTASEAGDIQ